MPVVSKLDRINAHIGIVAVYIILTYALVA